MVLLYQIEQAEARVAFGLWCVWDSSATIQAVLGVNADARLAALRAALFVVALVAALARFFTRWPPGGQPGSQERQQ